MIKKLPVGTRFDLPMTFAPDHFKKLKGYNGFY